MKQTFPGFYRPTRDEFRALWDSARFVPDANVLLNLYGYSAATRKKLLELLEGISQRLWMLLRHFDPRFTEAVTTALPKLGDRVNTQAPATKTTG